jgi:hypothetical protein
MRSLRQTPVVKIVASEDRARSGRYLISLPVGQPQNSRSSEKRELALALVHCQRDALETRYILRW